MDRLPIFEAIADILTQDYAGADQLRFTEARQPFLAFCAQLNEQHNFEDEQLFNFVQLYLQTIGNPKVVFAIRPHAGFQPYTRGFSARSDGSRLFVSDITGETRLKPGDQILKINYAAPAGFRSVSSMMQHEVLLNERDQWEAYLNHAKVLLVEHAGGEQEKIILKKFAPAQKPAQLTGQRLPDGAFCLRIDHFNDGGAIADLIAAVQEPLAQARHLILDLRLNQGGYAEAFAPLLPYLCDRETSLSQFLPENSVYTRFSPRNCDLSLAQLRPYLQSPDADVRATAAALSAEIQAQRGQPWVLEADSLSDERLPCRRSAQQITILTDSTCEDEAERFALACRRFSGVRLVGRPTRGSLEYSNPVSADFGFGCSLTYPISRSAACQAGQGYASSGVPVDVYIPWSPDEIHTDRVLAQALAQ